MRKGRGFRLKGFSTGNGKTSKPLVTGRQFGSKFDSPLSYTPDGVKPNLPKSNYVDQDAQDRADDIAHGDGISTPRPEVTKPPVDTGMPEVTPYSGDMTLNPSIYGEQTWDQLNERTRGILEDRRSQEGWSAAGDSSHPDSYYNASAPYLTRAEKVAGGDYHKYNPNSEFAINLQTYADREAYNKSAGRHARSGEAYKTTGMASYTEFDPKTGKRHTQEIRNPNFKPNNEQKVNLDAKPQVGSVNTGSAPTGKPTRGTQTKPTSTKTNTGKKSTSYSDAYKKRDKKIYGNLSEAEYTAEAKRQKAHHKKTGKWDAPKEAMKSKEKKK